MMGYEFNIPEVYKLVQGLLVHLETKHENPNVKFNVIFVFTNLR